MTVTRKGSTMQANGDRAVSQAFKTHAAGHRVWIRYARPHGIYVRGPQTGEPYVFNAGDSTLVDAADALALLESGLFERD